MRQSTKKKIKTVFALGMLTFCFQNFDIVNAFLVPVHKVDHESRVLHAKELLGKAYKGSTAHQAEMIQDLHVTIFEDVRQLLPKKYKSQALPLAETIVREAQRYDFDPVFIMAVIKTESSFNPIAKGSAGEIGLMQIKPKTAAEIALNANIPWNGPSTLESPIMNVKIGVAYFSQLRGKFAGYANKYIASYNMGAAKVNRLYQNEITPKEYSIRVIKNYNLIYKRMVASRSNDLAKNFN